MRSFEAAMCCRQRAMGFVPWSFSGCWNLDLLLALLFGHFGRLRFRRRRPADLGIKGSGYDAFGLVRQAKVKLARHPATGSFAEYDSESVPVGHISTDHFVLLIFPPQSHTWQRRDPVRGNLDGLSAEFLALGREKCHRETQVRGFSFALAHRQIAAG